jgi:hypothetical protein
VSQGITGAVGNSLPWKIPPHRIINTGVDILTMRPSFPQMLCHIFPIAFFSESHHRIHSHHESVSLFRKGSSVMLQYSCVFTDSENRAPDIDIFQ